MKTVKAGNQYYIARKAKPPFNMANRMLKLKKIDGNFVKSYELQIKKIEEYMKDNKTIFNDYDNETNEELWGKLENMLNDLLQQIESDYENIESDH